jgi:multidrug efflux pump subunit AcrB
MPLLLDNSLQAQFLIPMAVSLAFGVLFATLVSLLLIPCALLLADDVGRFLGGVTSWYFRPFQSSAEQTTSESA